jgi:hypothetical protein
MRKNMYIVPKTEVLTVNSEHLMQGISVSPGSVTDPSNPPGAGMPGRGDIIP